MEKMVYTVGEIQEILGISKNKAYSMVRNAYLSKDKFRVIKIEGTYRVSKSSFDKWVNEAN